MYRKHFFQTLSVLRISNVTFTNKLWYTKYIIKEVMLKDIATPPWEQLGTATPWIPMLLASPPKSSPSVIALFFSWWVGLLVSLAVYVLVSWLDGGAVVTLALCSCFDVLYAHIPWWQGEGQGSRWGGLATFARAVPADILVGFRV